jgi:hypothetical protein
MTRRWNDETGSLPMVILAGIILAGLVVVMFGQTRAAQISSRTDRDHHEAIQTADAGVQAALTYISTRDTDTWPEVGNQLTSDEVKQALESSSASEDVKNMLVGRTEFEWVAARVGGMSWEVRATGHAGGVSRIIEASFGPRQLFDTAMWAEHKLDGNMPGNFSPGTSPNWMNSGGYDTGFGAYHSGTGEVDDEEEIIAGTGGTCEFDPAPDGLIEAHYGNQFSGSGCDEHNDPMPPHADYGRKAFEPGGKCDPSEPLVGDYEGWDRVIQGENEFSGGFVLPEGPAPASTSAPVMVDRKTIFCLESLRFPSSYKMLLEDGDGHVEVYVRDDLIVEGTGANARKEINVSTDSGPPPAAAFRLFFADEGSTIRITNNNHVWIAASLYAPFRSCEFGTQTILYGAAVCRDINLHGGGGFQFWYDLATADIYADEETTLTGWREEFPSSTGFDWAL